MHRIRSYYVGIIVVTVVLLVAGIIGCAQPTTAPTPAPTPAPAPAPAPKGPEYTHKWVEPSPRASTMDRAMLEFNKMVQERSKGRIKIEYYPAGELVTQPQEIPQVRAAAISGMFDAVANFGGTIPAFNALVIPMVFPADQQKVIQMVRGPFGQALAKEAEKVGMKILGFGPGGYRDFLSIKKPILTPADMNGWKVRIIGNPVWKSTFEAWGAIPVTMPWTDVVPGLGSGVMDGVEVSWYHVPLVGLDPYIKFAVKSRYVPDFMILAMNLDQFKALPADLQKVYQDSANDMGDIYGKFLEEDYASSKTKMEAKGIKIIELTDAQRKAFKDLLGNVYKTVQENKDYGQYLPMIEAAAK